MKTLPRKPCLPHCLGRHQRDHPANERASPRDTMYSTAGRVRRHLPPVRRARSLATVDASSRIRRRGGDLSLVALCFEFRFGRSLVLAAAADEPTVSLTDAEREEMARPEASGDAFERLVELAKQGGVDIPPAQEPRGVHVGPMTVTDDPPRPNPSPASPRGTHQAPWLRQRAPGGERYKKISEDIRGLAATVCEEAMCPNLGECRNGDTGTATIMILGDTCTRGCRFCAVNTAQTPPGPDPRSPKTPPEPPLSGAPGTSCSPPWTETTCPTAAPSTSRAPCERSKNSARTSSRSASPRISRATCPRWRTSRTRIGRLAHNAETVERLQKRVRDPRAGTNRASRCFAG